MGQFTDTRYIDQLGISLDFQTVAFQIIIFLNNLVIYTKLWSGNPGYILQ